MKKMEIPPIMLEIYIEEDEDGEEVDITESFKKVLASSQFTEILKTELYEMVQEAIELKKEEFSAFRLVHYNIDLIIDKKYYKNLLNTILNLFTQEEDYLKCIEVKKLIESL